MQNSIQGISRVKSYNPYLTGVRHLCWDNAKSVHTSLFHPFTTDLALPCRILHANPVVRCLGR